MATKNKKEVGISIKLPGVMHERLIHMGNITHRSLASTIRVALEEYLRSREEEI